MSASCHAPSGRGSRYSPSTVSSVERAAGAPTERRRRTSFTPLDGIRAGGRRPAAAERGEDVVIARNGMPAARLVAIAAEHPPVRLGVLAGEIELGPDFDAPL